MKAKRTYPATDQRGTHRRYHVRPVEFEAMEQVAENIRRDADGKVYVSLRKFDDFKAGGQFHEVHGGELAETRCADCGKVLMLHVHHEGWTKEQKEEHRQKHADSRCGAPPEAYETVKKMMPVRRQNAVGEIVESMELRDVPQVKKEWNVPVPVKMPDGKIAHVPRFKSPDAGCGGRHYCENILPAKMRVFAEHGRKEQHDLRRLMGERYVANCRAKGEKLDAGRLAEIQHGAPVIDDICKQIAPEDRAAVRLAMMGGPEPESATAAESVAALRFEMPTELVDEPIRKKIEAWVAGLLE